MKIIHWTQIGPKEIKELENWLKGRTAVGLDSEFNGYRIFTVQIGDKDTSFVIEWSDQAQKALKSILTNDQITFIGHNIKADYKVLKANGITLKKVWDTMVMEIILNGGGTDLKYSLDMLVNRYCGVVIDKSLQSSFLRVINGLSKEQIEYAAHDVEYLDDIRIEQVKRLTVLDLMYLAEVENNAVLATGDMEMNGMRLDRDKLTLLIKRIEKEKEEAFQDLDEYVILDKRLSKFVPKATQGNLFGHLERKVVIDYNSSAQVVQVLQYLGLPITSSNENGLLKYEKDYPFVKKLLVYREKAKALSTYGKNFFDFIAEDGRVHTSYWPCVQTGRMSSSRPNLQNIPNSEDYRSIFIPEDGFKIVTGDYSGCELRFLAEGSKDPVFLKTFKEGGDLHTIVAMMLFGVAEDKVKEPLERLRGATPRQTAKIINFMLSYGGNEYKLAQTMQIPVEEAKTIIINYFKTFPKIKAFLDKLSQLGVSRGYIRSFPPTRRIRYWKDYNDPKLTEERKAAIGREARNAPIQAGNACATKVALAQLRECINENNYPVKIINVVHDEVNTECLADFAETWEPIMNKIMTESLEIFIKSIPCVVDTVISDTWYKGK